MFRVNIVNGRKSRLEEKPTKKYKFKILLPIPGQNHRQQRRSVDPGQMPRRTLQIGQNGANSSGQNPVCGNSHFGDVLRRLQIGKVRDENGEALGSR